MPEPKAICECKGDKLNEPEHLEHIRAYMIQTYGSDKCLRDGCPEQAQHKSGYCTEHHTEWLHGESARNLKAR